MKRFITQLTTLGLLLTAANAAQAELNIFACEPEWGALAQELAPNAEIYTATTAYQDPHNIQARPSLLARARQADLLFCTGAELEVGWLPVVLRRAGNSNIQPGNPGYFMAAEQVERLDIPQDLSLLDRSMGDVHASGNPHVHLDPRRMLTIAAALNSRLQSIDPTNTGAYQQRYDAFVTRWEQKIAEWELLAQPLKGQTIVLHHKSWLYLTEWLGMTISQTLEPKPGIPPSASHVLSVIQQLQQQPAMAIVYGPAADDRAAKRTSKATNIPAIALPYTVGAEGADDLFQLFDITLERLLSVHLTAKSNQSL